MVVVDCDELFIVPAGESQLFADVFWQRCAGERYCIIVSWGGGNGPGYF